MCTERKDNTKCAYESDEVMMVIMMMNMVMMMLNMVMMRRKKERG